MLQSVTIRRAISKNHKASLISELCHDVSQKYTKAAGEMDVSLIFLQAPSKQPSNRWVSSGSLGVLFLFRHCDLDLLG